MSWTKLKRRTWGRLLAALRVALAPWAQRIALAAARQETAALRELLGDRTVAGADLGFRDGGFLFVVAKVAGKDFVKVIPIPPQKTITDYARLLEQLRRDYGCHPERMRIDAMPGYDRMLKDMVAKAFTPRQRGEHR
jgi:hypothetical protein